MPAYFQIARENVDPLYFDDLSDLDAWLSKPRLPFVPHELLKLYLRDETTDETLDPNTHGKLLICHDYKGGYTEHPSSLSYTFNFWSYCDTFIYFAHRRVTIPPPGWINAAHRQGVKILGVLIFEHKESADDCLKLLLGNVPKNRSSSSRGQLPVTDHYACCLAELARERGFDGYLLNFEYPLPGRSEQIRALESWVSLLNSELKARVGDHAQTIWYDSIITTGDLRWQDSLNGLNLQFFLSSDSIFTNYTWSPANPLFSSEYLSKIETQILQGRNKTLSDIFFGVDIWGRGSHGGGGFGAYKALEHVVKPNHKGLSIAAFGQAWTWESDEGEPGWNWEHWWKRERTLWVGPERDGESIVVPVGKGEESCNHGDFRPFSDFFPCKPAINPDHIPLYVSFCPGVGYSWFVEGHRVMSPGDGWTDIDKQTSLGNLLWPRPNISWENEALEEPLPKVSSLLTFEDGYNSGSSLEIRLVNENTYSEMTFRCYMIPIQSIMLTPGRLYEIDLIYKIHTTSIELDLALSVKCVSGISIELQPILCSELAGGWSKLTASCIIPIRSSSEVAVNVGVIIGAAFEDTSDTYTCKIRLGQLSVVSKPSLSGISPFQTSLFWADCTTSESSSNLLSLSWDSCISFTEPAILRPIHLNPSCTYPAWLLDQSKNWMPRLMYANLYVEARSDESWNSPSNSALFVGTSGFDSGKALGGSTKRFYLDKEMLPLELRHCPLRFFIQGVTDRGVVLPWDLCAYVDI